jgi:hypothetical protein
MPFGLTYAEFVMGVGLSMFFGPADTAPPAAQWSTTLGTVTVGAGDVFDENVLTLTHRQSQQIWGKLQPIYAIGVSDQGMAFASAGLGRPLDVFGLKITPFTGPALYFDNNNNDVLQFRTGFDITQTVSDTLSLTGGYYHISNAQNNATSADIDVAHIGAVIKF